MIRTAEMGDARAITDIYNHYIVNTRVSFEEDPVTVDEMQQRIRNIQVKFPWLVNVEGGKVTGYAYASAWRPRAAYRFAVELSVYLDACATGKGSGSRLYEALLEELRNRGVKRAIGGVALPNPASQKLHEKFGFRKVAHFEKVGFKLGEWIDVAYWELSLD